MAEPIADVLASRYASPRIREIWSDRGRIVLERRLWIAVLRAQQQVGWGLRRLGRSGNFEKASYISLTLSD